MEDAPGLVALMARYYAEEGYPFDASVATRLTTQLIEEPHLGQLWVVVVHGRCVAYLAVTMGFSFEHGGVEACIDELYVDEDFRGEGLGARALGLAFEFGLERQARVLHLEVEPHRHRAAALYAERGFVTSKRRLMTQVLRKAPQS